MLKTQTPGIINLNTIANDEHIVDMLSSTIATNAHKVILQSILKENTLPSVSKLDKNIDHENFLRKVAPGLKLPERIRTKIEFLAEREDYLGEVALDFLRAAKQISESLSRFEKDLENFTYEDAKSLLLEAEQYREHAVLLGSIHAMVMSENHLHKDGISV